MLFPNNHCAATHPKHVHTDQQNQLAQIRKCQIPITTLLTKVETI